MSSILLRIACEADLHVDDSFNEWRGLKGYIYIYIYIWARATVSLHSVRYNTSTNMRVLARGGKGTPVGIITFSESLKQIVGFGPTQIGLL